MLEFMQNNVETPMGDNSHHGQGLGDQASFNVPPNLSGIPPIPPKLTTNIGNPHYYQTLVSELMRRIPPAPSEIPPKDNKLADRVVRHNLKVYDGK